MSSRVDYLEGFAAPRPRLAAFSGLIAALVLASDWRQSLVLMALGYLLGILAGKRIQVLYFLGLGASIVFFSLLNPFGQVLWRLGPLTLTQGALEEGLSRAFRLIGMVFASVAGIHRGLSFPGAAGRFLAMTLSYYDKLLESRHRLSLKNWVGSADEVLFEVFPLQEGSKTNETRPLPPQPHVWKTMALFLFVWAAAFSTLFLLQI